MIDGLQLATFLSLDRRGHKTLLENNVKYDVVNRSIAIIYQQKYPVMGFWYGECLMLFNEGLWFLLVHATDRVGDGCIPTILNFKLLEIQIKK